MDPASWSWNVHVIPNPAELQGKGLWAWLVWLPQAVQRRKTGFVCHVGVSAHHTSNQTFTQQGGSFVSISDFKLLKCNSGQRVAFVLPLQGSELMNAVVSDAGQWCQHDKISCSWRISLKWSSLWRYLIFAAAYITSIMVLTCDWMRYYCWS